MSDSLCDCPVRSIVSIGSTVLLLDLKSNHVWELCPQYRPGVLFERLSEGPLEREDLLGIEKYASQLNTKQLKLIFSSGYGDGRLDMPFVFENWLISVKFNRSRAKFGFSALTIEIDEKQKAVISADVLVTSIGHEATTIESLNSEKQGE